MNNKNKSKGSVAKTPDGAAKAGSHLDKAPNQGTAGVAPVNAEDEESQAAPLNFDRFAKNDPFPIHADLQDSEADLNSEKPGGIFTKHRFDEEDVDREMAELSMSDEDSEDAYGEPKVSGFLNTGSRKRLVYKMAEYKRKIATDKVTLTPERSLSDKSQSPGRPGPQRRYTQQPTGSSPSQSKSRSIMETL